MLFGVTRLVVALALVFASFGREKDSWDQLLAAVVWSAVWNTVVWDCLMYGRRKRANWHREDAA